MKQYGTILIGCGGVATGHLEAIRDSQQARLLGVVDLEEERARDYASRFGAESWATDYRQYLDRDHVEIVVITTWPSSHRQIVVDSLQASKNVLCEKPIAPDLDQAREMVEEVKRTGNKLVIGYILRHNASYQRIKEIIDDGFLGSPIIFRLHGAEHTTDPEARRRDVKLIKETSPIIDCGCHYVDVMRWFSGSEAVSVSGVGTRVDPATPADKYDYGIITIQFADGSVGTYEVGWGRTFRGFSQKELIGPRGRVNLVHAGYRMDGREEGDLIELYRYRGDDQPGECRSENVKGTSKPFDRQFQSLIEHIEQDLDCLPALDDALKSLEIVLAGHRAIIKQETVKLPLG